jgi:hypothetical protein
MYIYILVGGKTTSLKTMSSSVGMMTIPNIWKNKKCSMPPTNFLHFREYLNSEFTHEQLVSLGFNRIGITI